jgi:hypothetical protein
MATFLGGLPCRTSKGCLFREACPGAGFKINIDLKSRLKLTLAKVFRHRVAEHDGLSSRIDGYWWDSSHEGVKWQ